MLKKITLGVSAVLLSASVFAGKLAVVDMQHIFHASTQMKSINTHLTQRFSAERKAIVKMGEGLKADMDKYNKNKTVLSKKSLAALQDKIGKEEVQLRKKQSSFQKSVYEAQNKAMSDFVDKAKAAVAKEAEAKKVDLVLPKNAVLYSGAQTVDLTDAVLKALD